MYDLYNYNISYIHVFSIVGDADGGTLFTDEEYEKFKAKAIEARKKRIYVYS